MRYGFLGVTLQKMVKIGAYVQKLSQN